MKNIIAVVNMNGGIWLNVLEILSFNIVSIAKFGLLSFLLLSAVVEMMVSRDIFVWVPLDGEVGGVEFGDDVEDVMVKTCKSFIKIFNNGEEEILSSDGEDLGYFGTEGNGGWEGKVFAPTKGLLFKPQLGYLQ